MNYVWTPESFGAVIGVLLTLIFTLAPKLNTWYAAKDDDTKRQIMALFLIGISIIGGIISCLGFIIVMTCTQDGFIIFTLKILVPALVTNQGVNLLVPKPQAVKRANVNGKVSRGEILPPVTQGGTPHY